MPPVPSRPSLVLLPSMLLTTTPSRSCSTFVTHCCAVLPCMSKASHKCKVSTTALMTIATVPSLHLNPTACAPPLAADPSSAPSLPPSELQSLLLSVNNAYRLRPRLRSTLPTFDMPPIPSRPSLVLLRSMLPNHTLPLSLTIASLCLSEAPHTQQEQDKFFEDRPVRCHLNNEPAASARSPPQH